MPKKTKKTLGKMPKKLSERSGNYRVRVVNCDGEVDNEGEAFAPDSIYFVTRVPVYRDFIQNRENLLGFAAAYVVHGEGNNAGKVIAVDAELDFLPDLDAATRRHLAQCYPAFGGVVIESSVVDGVRTYTKTTMIMIGIVDRLNCDRRIGPRGPEVVSRKKKRSL